MVALPQIADPTLEAADRALAEVENNRPRRRYLGMSEIGRSCARALWYNWRYVIRVEFSADTHKRFLDGHSSEDVQAKRLRMVEGLTLLTLDPETGRQFRFVDNDGHFCGHMDGAIVGLIQAPKTWHVWEHKCVAERKFEKLTKLKSEVGEKNALAQWDPVYYAQAVLYMHYSGMDRHYLTCSTPGVRKTVSVRTNADPEMAIRLIAKAKRILSMQTPPERIASSETWHECRMCDFADVCWGRRLPDKVCRTCLHSTPADGGQWHCAKWDVGIALAGDDVCPAHLYLPGLIDGEALDAAQDGTWVDYRMRDGSIWRNEAMDAPF